MLVPLPALAEPRYHLPKVRCPISAIVKPIYAMRSRSGMMRISAQPASVTADITAASLTIKADNIEIKVGAPEPTYTYTPTGFVNGETSAVIAPISVSAFEVTVGLNPVRGSDGVVNIFLSGKDGALTVYDVTGNVVQRINVNGNHPVASRHPATAGNNVNVNCERCIVGSWDLRDAKGKTVSAGGVSAAWHGQDDRRQARAGVGYYRCEVIE